MFQLSGSGLIIIVWNYFDIISNLLHFSLDKLSRMRYSLNMMNETKNTEKKMEYTEEMQRATEIGNTIDAIEKEIKFLSWNVKQNGPSISKLSNKRDALSIEKRTLLN